VNARDDIYETARSVIDGELGILVNQSDIENTADSLSYALIAAGYSKPRTITTAEELDMVDTGAVVRDETGDVLKLTQRGWLSTDDEDVSYVVLPATVLYAPEVSK